MTQFFPLYGVVTVETDKAVLIELDVEEYGEMNAREIWVPRSVCEDGDHVGTDDTSAQVAKWWLEKNGLA